MPARSGLVAQPSNRSVPLRFWFRNRYGEQSQFHSIARESPSCGRLSSDTDFSACQALNGSLPMLNSGRSCDAGTDPDQ